MALGTSPDDLGTSPDDLGTSPDDLGTSPDDLGTSPDDLGTSPDDLGTPHHRQVESRLAPRRVSGELNLAVGDAHGTGQHMTLPRQRQTNQSKTRARPNRLHIDLLVVELSRRFVLNTIWFNCR